MILDLTLCTRTTDLERGTLRWVRGPLIKRELLETLNVTSGLTITSRTQTHHDVAFITYSIKHHHLSLVSFPDPDSQPLRVDYITATW